jgi:hypothetical protein
MYSLSGIIVRGGSYLVLRLQTNILVTSEYSIITEFYGNYISLGHVLFLLSMDMAYCRFVYKLGRQHTFNTTITILLISSVLLSISLIIYTPQIAQITDHLSHIRYFYYITAILTLDTLLAIPYVSLRVEKKNFAISVDKIFTSFY